MRYAAMPTGVCAAVQAIGRAFDPTHGGFGFAHKFFHTMNLRLCLRYWARTGNRSALGMVTVTLDCQATIDAS